MDGVEQLRSVDRADILSLITSGPPRYDPNGNRLLGRIELKNAAVRSIQRGTGCCGFINDEYH